MIDDRTLWIVGAGALALSWQAGGTDRSAPPPADTGPDVVIHGERPGPPCPEAQGRPASDQAQVCAAARLALAAEHAQAIARQTAGDHAGAAVDDHRAGIASEAASNQRLARDLRHATSLARPATPPHATSPFHR